MIPASAVQICHQFNLWFVEHLYQYLVLLYQNRCKESCDTISQLVQKCPHSPFLHCRKGVAFVQLGQFCHAEECFVKARSLDLNIIDNIDVYAWNLRALEKASDLNSLCAYLFKTHPYRPETWISLAICCHLKMELERSLAYCEVAIGLKPHYQQAHLVKGFICLSELNSVDEHESENVELLLQEAIKSWKTAYEIDSNSIVALKGLIDVLLFRNETREAVSLATAFYNKMKSNPFVESLLATVLLRSGSSKARQKAQTLFRNALKRFKKECTPNLACVLGLTDLYQEDSMFQEAVKLLTSQFDFFSEYSDGPLELSILKRRLGEVYEANRDYQLAMEAYHESCEFSNQEYEICMEGLERIGKLMQDERDRRQETPRK